MKKKLAILVTAAMTAGMISACGSDAGKTEESQTQTTESEAGTETGTEAGAETGTESAAAVVLKDLDVESYVTLNDYSAMAVTIQKPTIGDEDVDAYIADVLSKSGNVEGVAVMDRAVKEGDTVNINYVGTLDGVAFEGGTDDSEAGTNLGIGSGAFIEGFEEGLIGATPGETVELNLTFPENYTNAEMAGKETVFTVEVNGIAPAELTEEMVPLLNEETATIEEYRQFVLDTLTEEAQTQFDNSYDSYVEDAVIQKLVEECTYAEVPAELTAKYNTNITKNLTSTASMYGLDLETYASYVYGMNKEAFGELLNSWAEQSAQQALAFQAIANKENLNVSDETLEEGLQTQAETYGYESAEDFLAGSSKEEYREYLMFNGVLEYLTKNAQVTVE